MHGCLCGYLGDARRECTCTQSQITRYRRRISGPLPDRIDVHVEVPRVKYEEMAGVATGELSKLKGERNSSLHTAALLTGLLTVNGQLFLLGRSRWSRDRHS
ncbi:MAG: ATP-binding protein [Chloroflexi bacterium]|nr:ATP-binding protein [Chloroflexota bacterium]